MTRFALRTALLSIFFSLLAPGIVGRKAMAIDKGSKIGVPVKDGKTPTPDKSGKIAPPVQFGKVAAATSMNRKVSSATAPSLLTTKTRKIPRASETKNINLGIGVTSGISSMGSTSSSTGDGTPFRNLYYGLQANMHAFTYLDVEADGYHAALGETTTQTNAGDYKEKTQNYGGNALAGVRVPFRTGVLTITPRLNAGYSINRINNAQTFDSGNSSEDTSIDGLVALGGVDLTFGRFSLFGDYMRSLSVSGQDNFSATISGTTQSGNSKLTGSAIERIRTGLRFKFTRIFSLGAQYQRRNFVISTESQPDNSVNMYQNEFLGLVLLEL